MLQAAMNYPFGRAGRALVLSLFVLLTTACTGFTQGSQDWIDVPLAEDVFFALNPQVSMDTIEIPVPANSDLEYMLDMRQGYSVSYRWEAADLENGEELLAEFHGHTVRVGDAPGQVMFYQQGRGRSASGYLVAPFDGVHGWYLSNESSNDILVTLQLSGFYAIQ